MRLDRTRLLVVVLVVVVVAIVLLLRTPGSTREADAFRNATVERGDISVLVTATGTLSPLNTVQVGSQISGTIAELHADFNSRVRNGELIALIDTTFLAASVKESRAALERSRAEAKQAEMELQRAKVLVKKEIISQLEYDIVATAYQSALATVRSGEAQLERAVVSLRHASIRAPVDGVVISRNVDVGQTVAASFSAPTLFLIANDLKNMQLEAQIDEGDIGMVREGQRVTFTVNAYPEKVFEGIVSQVRLEPITVQDVVSYTIIVAVSNPREELMPGMTANLSVHADERSDVLKVPNAALRFKPPGVPSDMQLQDTGQGTGPGKKLVWRLAEDGSIEPVRVDPGITDGSYTEVSSPVLAEGDIVVTGFSRQGSRGEPRTQNNPFQPRFRRPQRRSGQTGR